MVSIDKHSSLQQNIYSTGPVLPVRNTVTKEPLHLFQL
jgi:hypothetical protein